MSTRRGKFETCPYVRGSIGIMEGRDGRFANRPYEEGGRMVDGWRCGQDWGMGSRPRLHGGRLCAGTTGGDVGMRGGCTRRGKFQTCPYVRGSIGIMWGRDGRFANRPYEGRRDIEVDGWGMVAGSARDCGDGFPPSSSCGGGGSAPLREQRMDSRLRLHGGRGGWGMWE